MRVAEIREDELIDIARFKGGSEYRFLIHVWYYASIPTFEQYLRYDRSKLL